MLFLIIALIIIVLYYHYYYMERPAGYDWGSPTVNWGAINTKLTNDMNKAVQAASTLPTTLPVAQQDTLNKLNAAVTVIQQNATKIVTDSPKPGAPVQSDGFRILGGPLLTVAQISFVDDKGVALQYGNFKNIAASSQYKPYTSPDNVLDTNTYFTSYPHVWHPSGADTSAWMSASFDSVKKISQVKIYNRSDCCQNRIDGAHFSLYLGGNIVFNKNLNSADFTNNTYTISLV